MKLLMENWRKFVNESEEMLDSTGVDTQADEEFEEKIEKLGPNLAEELKEKIVDFFSKNPEVAEKVANADVESAESLSEELTPEEKADKDSYEEISNAIGGIGLVGGAIGTFMSMVQQVLTQNVSGDYGHGSHWDPLTMFLTTLGASGTALFLSYVANRAKESLEKKERESSSGQPPESLSERKLTKPQTKKKEKFVKGMKPAKKDFEKRYPGRGKEVMYATATKMAKKKKKKEED